MKNVIEKLKQKILDKIIELNYYLWQSLITVNSLLATLLIAIVTFKPLSPINKLLLFIGFFLSTTSCVILITNFLSTRKVYSNIHGYLNKDHLPTEQQANKESKNAIKTNQQNSINENIAILSSVIAWLILILVIFSFITKAR